MFMMAMALARAGARERGEASRGRGWADSLCAVYGPGLSLSSGDSIYKTLCVCSMVLGYGLGVRREGG